MSGVTGVGAGGGGCILPYTQIAVDMWKFRQTSMARVFFLSHVDQEKLAGLTPGWSQPIYCSPISRSLLLQRIAIDPTLVHALELDQPHTVPLTEPSHDDGESAGAENGENASGENASGGVCGTAGISASGVSATSSGISVSGGGEQPVTITVTLIDSNHCPGSVMLLFEGYFGRVIYTGDFRLSPTILQSPVFCEFVSRPVDALYLDNTYCSPKCCFPSQAEAIQEVIDIVERYPYDKVVIGLRDLGNNDVLIRLARQFKTRVGVTEERYRALELLLDSQLPPLKDELTTAAAAGQTTSIGDITNAAAAMDTYTAELTASDTAAAGLASAADQAASSAAAVASLATSCRMTHCIASSQSGITDILRTNSPPLAASDLFSIIPPEKDLSSDCRINAVPVVCITRPNLETWNREHRTVVILATAVFTALGFQPFQRDAQIVELSTHSSYAELIEFVSSVRPKSVVPLARGAGASGGVGSGISGVETDPLATSLPDRASIECFQEFLDRTPMQNFHIPPAVLELMNQVDTSIESQQGGTRKRARRRKVAQARATPSLCKSRVKSSSGSEISYEPTGTSSVTNSRASNKNNSKSRSASIIDGQDEGSLVGFVQQRISQRTAAAAARQALLIQVQRQQLLQPQQRQLGATQQRYVEQSSRLAAAAALASMSTAGAMLGGRKSRLFMGARPPLSMLSAGSRIQTVGEGKPKAGASKVLDKRGGVVKLKEAVSKDPAGSNSNGSLGSNSVDVALNVLNHDRLGPVLSIPLDSANIEPTVISEILPKEEQDEALDLSLSGATSNSVLDSASVPNIKIVHEISTPSSIACASELISTNHGLLLLSDSTGPTVLLDAGFLGDFEKSSVLFSSSDAEAVQGMIQHKDKEGQDPMGYSDAKKNLMMESSTSTIPNSNEVLIVGISDESVGKGNNHEILCLDGKNVGIVMPQSVIPVDKALKINRDNLQTLAHSNRTFFSNISEVLSKGHEKVGLVDKDAEQMEMPAKCLKRFGNLDAELNERSDRISENIVLVSTEFRNPLVARSPFSSTFVPYSSHDSVLRNLDKTLECNVLKQEHQSLDPGPPDLLQSITDTSSWVQFTARSRGVVFQDATRKPNADGLHAGHHQENKFMNMQRMEIDNEPSVTCESKDSIGFLDQQPISLKAPSEGFIPGLNELKTFTFQSLSTAIKSEEQMDLSYQSTYLRRGSLGALSNRQGLVRPRQGLPARGSGLDLAPKCQSHSTHFSDSSNLSSHLLIVQKSEDEEQGKWRWGISEGVHMEREMFPVPDRSNEMTVLDVSNEGIEGGFRSTIHSKLRINDTSKRANMPTLHNHNSETNIMDIANDQTMPDLHHVSLSICNNSARSSSIQHPTKCADLGGNFVLSKVSPCLNCRAHDLVLALAGGDSTTLKCVCGNLSAARTMTLHPTAVSVIQAAPSALTDGLLPLAGPAGLPTDCVYEGVGQVMQLGLGSSCDISKAAAGLVSIMDGGEGASFTTHTMPASEQQNIIESKGVFSGVPELLYSCRKMSDSNIITQTVSHIMKSSSLPRMASTSAHADSTALGPRIITPIVSRISRSSPALSSKPSAGYRATLTRLIQTSSGEDRASPGLNHSGSEVRLHPKKKWRKRYRSSAHQENRLVMPITALRGVVPSAAGTCQSLYSINSSQSMTSSGCGRGTTLPSTTEVCNSALPSCTLPDLVAPLTSRPAPLAQNIDHRACHSLQGPKAGISHNLDNTGYMTRARAAVVSSSGHSRREGCSRANAAPEVAKKTNSAVVSISNTNSSSYSITNQCSTRVVRVPPHCTPTTRERVSPDKGLAPSVTSTTPPHIGFNRLRRLDVGVASPSSYTMRKSR